MDALSCIDRVAKDSCMVFCNLNYNFITSLKDCQMDIALEHLELLPEILKKLTLIEKNMSNFESKRWMNVKEVGKYLGYSADHIYKLRDEEFIEGIHFHKKGKLLFDRLEIDRWVIGGSNNLHQATKDRVNPNC